jgi:chitosanase
VTGAATPVADSSAGAGAPPAADKSAPPAANDQAATPVADGSAGTAAPSAAGDQAATPVADGSAGTSAPSAANDQAATPVADGSAGTGAPSAANDQAATPVADGSADRSAPSAANDQAATPVADGSADRSAPPAANDQAATPVADGSADRSAPPAANDQAATPVADGSADRSAPPAANDQAATPVADGSADTSAPPAANDQAATPEATIGAPNTFAPPAANGPPTKSCIEQMIGIFENESISLTYDEIEDLNDGHGYTAGRAGFTTKEGDLLQVVELYDSTRPKNVLSGFIPILEKVRGTPSTEGLGGLPAAWKKAASDPLFREAQDQVSDELYYTPAMMRAENLHLQSPLAKFALYDAVIQHGIGEESDSLDGIIRAATRAAGPPTEAGEKKWLMAFLTARKKVLLNARDPETRTTWKESVGRVDEQLRLLNEGNLQLSSPLTLNPYGTEFTVYCATSSSDPPGKPKNAASIGAPR